MASQQVFSDLDISGKAKSSAQGIFMGAVSSLPSASALSGGVVFNTTDSKHYISDGSAWSVVELTAGRDSDGMKFSEKYATQTQIEDAVSGFVTADGILGVTDTVPPTFDGHTSDAFVYHTQIVSEVTSGSTSPVSSGGVYSAISSYQTELDNTQTELASVRTEVTTAQTSIVDMSAEIDSVQASISGLNTSISSKLEKSGGTMTGKLVAQNNTSYSTKQVRNIFISTSDPSGGSYGDIWIKYSNSSGSGGSASI